MVLQPGIIHDILSGILIIWKASGKANCQFPPWSVPDEKIPCLVNYMKVIEALKEAVLNTRESSSDSVLPAVFHKDWNHIADILLHQYEQYLVLLLDMQPSCGLDVTNFFPIVMYPDLIGTTRISKKERDLLRESLVHASFLKPKSHHFFYRNNRRMKIPLTFSACMEAYVNGGDALCPDWSMESVPYDIFFNLDDFMVDVRFFRQPPSSNLCGVFALNNVTQSDLVISKSTPFSRKKASPPLCLTLFAADLQKNVLMGMELAENVSDSEGTAKPKRKSAHKTSPDAAESDSESDFLAPLHDDKKGTSFILLESVLIHLGFAVGTNHIDYSSPEKFGSSLVVMHATDGWILQYCNSVASDIAHIVGLRRLSSSHVLLLDSEDPAPRVFNHKSCYEYFRSTGSDSMLSFLVNNLPALPWCSQANISAVSANGMVKCFVSHEYLTSNEFSSRLPISGKQDSKLSELPTTTITDTEPRITELNTTSNKDITPEPASNGTGDEGSASSKEKSDDEDNGSSVPIITSQSNTKSRKRTATVLYTSTFLQTPKKKRSSSSITKVNTEVPLTGDLFSSSSGSDSSSDDVEADVMVRVPSNFYHEEADVQPPCADSHPSVSIINSLNSCVNVCLPTLLFVRAIVKSAKYLSLGESDEKSMFIKVHCDALPTKELQDIEAMKKKTDIYHMFLSSISSSKIYAPFPLKRMLRNSSVIEF